MLCGCSMNEPDPPLIVVVPGPGKTTAAFQQDDAACRQHAATHAGYDAAGTPDPSAAPQITDETAYAQCMASRGEAVQVQAEPVDPPPYRYLYGDPFAFSDLYVGGVFPNRFAWTNHTWHHGWHDGGLHNGGWHGGHHDGPGHLGSSHAGSGHGGHGHPGFTH